MENTKDLEIKKKINRIITYLNKNYHKPEYKVFDNTIQFKNCLIDNCEFNNYLELNLNCYQVEIFNEFTIVEIMAGNTCPHCTIMLCTPIKYKNEKRTTRT